MRIRDVTDADLIEKVRVWRRRARYATVRGDNSADAHALYDTYKREAERRGINIPD